MISTIISKAWRRCARMGGLSSIMSMMPGLGNLGGKMPDLDSEEKREENGENGGHDLLDDPRRKEGIPIF